MEQNRILICTEDVIYGKRLLKFLAGKANKNVEFGLLTSLEKEIEEQKNVIYFKKNNEQESLMAISKYQSAESIYQEILTKYQILDVCPPLSKEEKKNEVICIFSLDRGNDGVLYALKEGANYAKEAKTILISLSALPILLSKDMFSGELSRYCLSELFLGIEDEGFIEKVKELVFNIHGMDALPPIRYYKDLLDIKAEDILQLISRLQKECGYEVCIILCSEFYEFTLELLSFMHKITIPMKKDVMNQIRWKVMKHYFHMENKEELIDKISWYTGEVPLEFTKEGIISWITEEEGVIIDEYE